MCKYCDPIRNGDYASPPKIIKWPARSSDENVRAQIINETGVRNVRAVVLYCGFADEPTWSHNGVPIKYCPWCGQKLEKNYDNK